ncbi:MAG: hypothetical protein QM778_24800 [Myxococcales bacterium]
MKRSWQLGLVFSIALMGCTGAHLVPRFRSVGKIGGPPRAAAPVQAENVAVYQASAPEGFKLDDLELRVEPGYTHEVIGSIVLDSEGYCDLGEKGTYSFANVTKALQGAAAERGGTAVIYAAISVTDQEMADCKHASEMTIVDGKRVAAAGWIVVVGKGPEAAAPTAAVPAAGGEQPAAETTGTSNDSNAPVAAGQL